MESVAGELVDLVLWYKDVPEDYIDIAELIHKRKMISTYNVTLSTEVGNARKEWKLSEGVYEKERNQTKADFMLKGRKLGEAECFMKANPPKSKENTIINEAIYYKLYYFYGSIKEILSEMNQKISYLKDELKQEKYFNTGA